MSTDHIHETQVIGEEDRQRLAALEVEAPVEITEPEKVELADGQQVVQDATRGSSAADRRAHVPEDEGSSPSPASETPGDDAPGEEPRTRAKRK